MFSIRCDLEHLAFCQACLVGKPLKEMSTDDRYCQTCHGFLEAKTAEPSQQTSAEGCGNTTRGGNPFPKSCHARTRLQRSLAGIMATAVDRERPYLLIISRN